MNRYRKFGRSRLFITWLLSYLFILLLPLTIGFIVSSYTYQTICEEIQIINENSLEQLRSLTDNSFSALDRIGGNLSLSSDVRLLLSSKESFSGKKILNIIRVQETLGSYILTDSLIDDIWLYMPNQQCILSSTYKYNADSFESFCHTQLNMEPMAVEQSALTKQATRLRMIHREPMGTRILYFVPLFTNGYAKPSGLLIVRIDKAQLSNMMGSVSNMHHSYVFIVNNAGESYGTDSGFTSHKLPASYDEIQKLERTSTLSYHEQQYTMSHLDSTVTGVQFVSLTSTAAYQRKASNVRHITVCYVLICLLIGMLLSIIFTQKNYYPIKRMKRLLQKSSNNSLDSNDEYQMMETAIHDLLKTESELGAIREHHREAQRNNLLLRLLLGRDTYSDAFSSLLSTYGIHFLGENYITAELFVVNEMSAEIIRSMVSSNSSEILTRAINEIGLSVLDDHFTSVMALINGNYVFIINTVKDNTQKMSSQVREDMKKIQSFILERFGIEFCVNISGLHLGQEAIANAYSDNMLIQEYRRFYNHTSPVLCIDDLDYLGSEADMVWLNTAEHRQFRLCLENNDFKNAEILLQTLFNKMPESLHSARLLTSRAITLAGAIENYISTLPGELDEQTHRELMKTFRDITRAESAASIFILLNALLSKAEKLTVEKCPSSMPECVDMAVNYVSNHYANKELSVAAVADAIGFSSAYLSRTFKKTQRIGLLDYIHMTRLQKAKEFIRTKSVSEVAEMVGYYDSKALISAFKRYEGTTPGKFRSHLLDK